MPITFRDYRPLAEENEGNIPWMYLDTRGNVTVGIGHLLAVPVDAEALRFIEQDTGRPAAREGIRAAHAAVQGASQLAASGAGAFEAVSTVRLTEAGVEAVFERDFSRIIRRTRALFQSVGGGFDSYPDPAQIAVVDMAFNLGPDGLFRKYRKFRNNGLARRDFAVAADECFRHGISAARNTVTRSLLLEAAGIELRDR